MELQTALEWLNQRDLFTGPFGLHRMEYLMDRLDHPEREFPCVLVGGTNGKGSVTALLESIFVAGDHYQVGSTISPHLMNIMERIRIQGQPLEPPFWQDGVTALQDAAKVMERESSLGAPSFFELVTALAFWAFRETDRDIGLVEVGLGGRLDATNVTDPEISVITNIGTDHQELLGDDRTKIAREKLGIIRPKRCLISGEADPAIRALFTEACGKKKAELFFPQRDEQFAVETSHARGHRLRLTGDEAPLDFPMAGMHQLDNLALVLAVVERLRINGFDLAPEAVRAGIERVSWPGRLQWIDGSPPILLDGAHNQEGLASLTAYLDAFPLPRPLHLVFGAMRSKPFQAMARALQERADSLSFVGLQVSRALTREEFATSIGSEDPRWAWHDSLASAVEAGRGAGSILITGSLYLVAEGLRLLRKA